jgi:hypothetical protein
LGQAVLYQQRTMVVQTEVHLFLTQSLQSVVVVVVDTTHRDQVQTAHAVEALLVQARLQELEAWDMGQVQITGSIRAVVVVWDLLVRTVPQQEVEQVDWELPILSEVLRI